MKTKTILIGAGIAAVLYYLYTQVQDKKEAAQTGGGASQGPSPLIVLNETGTAESGKGESYMPGSQTSTQGEGTNTTGGNTTSQSSGTSSGSGSDSTSIPKEGALPGEGSETYVPNSMNGVFL